MLAPGPCDARVLPSNLPQLESGSRMRVAHVGSGARPGVGRAACWSLPAPCSPWRLSFMQSKPCADPCAAPLSTHLYILRAQSPPALSLGISQLLESLFFSRVDIA